MPLESAAGSRLCARRWYNRPKCPAARPVVGQGTGQTLSHIWELSIFNMEPDHLKESLQPLRGAAKPPQRAQILRSDSSGGERSGTPYIPLPEQDQRKEPGGSSGNKSHPPHRFRRWLLLAVAACGIAIGSWYLFPRTPAANMLVLTAADIDQNATEDARTALNRGEIPASLTNSSPEIRKQVQEGELALSTKRLLDPQVASGVVVHVTVSVSGQLTGVDLLTSERPVGTVFPIGRKTPTRFHFVVDQAGSVGFVTCSVHSITGRTAVTGPLTSGQQADLEVIEQ
jgi:hypothetical protein